MISGITIPEGALSSVVNRTQTATQTAQLLQQAPPTKTETTPTPPPADSQRGTKVDVVT